MKTKLLLAVIIAVGASTEQAWTERYDADPSGSHLTVTGTSTVHDWTAETRRIDGSLIVHEEELALFWASSEPLPRPLTPTVRVEIPVTSLTSGKRGMDEKMRDALKAATHPTITYRLSLATIIARRTDHGEDVEGRLTIETQGVLSVAGTERTVAIPMRVRRLSENHLEISGDTSLCMTDFGIKPPTAMVGMLRAGDVVHVRWTWVVNRSQPAIDTTPVP